MKADGVRVGVAANAVGRGEFRAPLERQAPAWAAPYSGLPFVSGGRTRAGVDCWGLVRLVYAEVFGIELPSYRGSYSDANRGPEVARLIEAERAAGAWAPVPVRDTRLGDAVLLRTKGFAMHVGLLVARGEMLHVEAGIDAMIERLASPVWNRRTVGYFRLDDPDIKAPRCSRATSCSP